VLLENQLHSALEDLESAKLIIKLLQKESDEDFPHGDRTSAAINSSTDTSALVQSDRLEDNKWTVITAKCRRKGFLSKNLTEANNTYPLSTANRYEQPTNLQDTQANNITPKIQEENNASDIPNHDYQTKLLHQSRGSTQRTRKENREDFQIYHIPALLNDKIGNKSMETVSSVVTYMNSVTKNKLRQHKIT